MHECIKRAVSSHTDGVTAHSTLHQWGYGVVTQSMAHGSTMGRRMDGSGMLPDGLFLSGILRMLHHAADSEKYPPEQPYGGTGFLYHIRGYKRPEPLAHHGTVDVGISSASDIVVAEEQAFEVRTAEPNSGDDLSEYMCHL